VLAEAVAVKVIALPLHITLSISDDAMDTKGKVAKAVTIPFKDKSAAVELFTS
jgi:hypothetical protein